MIRSTRARHLLVYSLCVVAGACASDDATMDDEGMSAIDHGFLASDLDMAAVSSDEDGDFRSCDVDADSDEHDRLCTVFNTPQFWADHPLPRFSAYTSVWISDARKELWALGLQGDVIQWRCGDTSRTYVGELEPNNPFNLSNIWAIGPNDAWITTGLSAILHFDGTNWTRIRKSHPEDYLAGIWGSGPKDIWAVGAGIFHYDGTAWSEVVSYTSLPPTLGRLFGVWGTGPNDVWAVGDGANFLTVPILHFDGKHWFAVPGGAFSQLWGSGPCDVWAAGPIGISHWDGTTWTRTIEAEKTTTSFDGIWGTGPNNVWAVGKTGIDSTSTVIYRWNGKVWQSSVPMDMPENSHLRRVWGGGPDNVWLVGDYYPNDGHIGYWPLIYHWDGESLFRVPYDRLF